MYWTLESWGSEIPPANAKEIISAVNTHLMQWENDDDARYEESGKLWEQFCAEDEVLGIKAIPLTEAQQLAMSINNSGEWIYADCEKLCKLMGMESEWEAADGESFEAVVEEAIQKALSE